MTEENQLARAARDFVLKQRLRIANAKMAAHDTRASEELLEQFERALAIFEADLKAILDEGSN